MRKINLLAFVLATILLTGCGDSHKKIMLEMVALQNEISTILDGVTDEASAKAAVSKIEAVGKRWKETMARLETLPPPSEAEAKEVDQSQVAFDAHNRMGDAILNLEKKPELMEHVRPALVAHEMYDP